MITPAHIAPCMVQPAPRFNKQALDLDAFWSIVVQKYGGYDSVCQNKLWASVARVMGASAGMTNASFCIRRLYERCLLPYERYKLQGTAPSPTKSWPNSMPADDGERHVANFSIPVMWAALMDMVLHQGRQQHGMLLTFTHDDAPCLRLTGEEEGGLSGCSQQEAPGPTSSGGSLQRGRPARSNRGRHSRWGDEMLDWEEVRRRPRSRRASGEEGRTRWSVLGPGESQECSQSQAAHGLTEADDDEADETEALDTTWISGGWVGPQVDWAAPRAELRGHLLWRRIASLGADTACPDESMRAHDEASRFLRAIT